jgi:osmoprotectant transport system substrate-binding protein
MRRPCLTAALATTALLTLTSCGGSDPLAGGGSSGGDDPNTVVVGAANFTESQILAAIFAQALQAKGVAVETVPPIGSREAYIPALRDGSIDLVPEYTGALLHYLDKDTTQTAPDEVFAALQQALATQDPDLTLLNRSAAEDKDAVVVTRETAQRLNATSIADLAPHCGELVFGGPPEFQERREGIPGIAQDYGCTFRSYRSLDAGGPLTVAALVNGDVQAADMFTTDAAIPDNDLVALTDPKTTFAAQNVVPLIDKAEATPQVTEILNAITAKLTTAELTALNAAAAAPDKPSVASVAESWLTRNDLV